MFNNLDRPDITLQRKCLYSWKVQTLMLERKNTELQVNQYFTEINFNTSFPLFVKGLEESHGVIRTLI